MNMSVLGIDLAKNVLQLPGVDEQGNVVVRQKLTRPKLLTCDRLTPATRRTRSYIRYALPML